MVGLAGTDREARLGLDATVLLVNTAARQGAEAFERARKYLAALGLPLVEARAVDAPDQLERLVRAAMDAGVRRVVIGGGDGSLSAAAHELWKQPVKLGVLPLGTCNDFARSLGLPLDLEEACRAVAGNTTRRVDLGVAGGRVFLNAASVGLSSAVTRRVNDDLKRRIGRGAFAVAAAAEAVGHRPFRTILTTPEGVDDVEAHMVVVGNGRFHGGGQLVAPDASHDDRRLDVYVIQSVQRPGGEGETPEKLRDLWNLMQVAVKLRRGTHLEHEAVLHRRVRSVKLETDPPQEVDLDGELWGQTPTRFEVKPAALEVLVPA